MEWLKGLVGRREQVSNAEDARADEELESAQERRQRWRSLYIIYFTMFQMSLGFSIVLTGVWPYLDKLAPGTSKEALGWVVGANPLGQVVASPLLGFWANRAGSARAPMLASLALFTLASAVYASLHLARPHAYAWMLVARTLIGVSSANVAVARSYLSAATRDGERTRAVAAVSLAQVLGFVVGPALQAAVTPLGPGPPYPLLNSTAAPVLDSALQAAVTPLGPGPPYPPLNSTAAPVLDFALQAAVTPLGPGPPYLPLNSTAPAALLRLDMYTAAGWINALFGAINFVLFLPFCFKEKKIAAREAMLAHGKETEKEAMKSLKPDLVSSWTLVVAFFVLVFNFVLLETLATPLTVDQFGWSKPQALQNMGALMSAGAVVACVVFALISPLTRIFEERALLLYGGFLLTGAASLLCIPWGPGPPPLAPAGAPLGAEAGGGCPQAAQPWCPSSRGMTLPQFLMGYAAVSVGYPLGVTLIQTIFSKVLGPRPQGVWQGVLAGAGSGARALGPAFVAAVYARRGPAPTFATTAALTLLTLAGLRALYPRLRPPPLAPPAAELQLLRPAANGGPAFAAEHTGPRDANATPLT